ncbi:MFS transporter [Mycolicibacterium sp. J2]|uniref:MFS transporter n=1 Tax=Mycolicibacterium sp. J2 TaxID=2993511 RepID=UPI00224AF3C4|nr:MFS transporter [Mycolicibacterium sp. J2]MCX2713378.1 MFS transporter [Mycolicibacterium sp. J2]
MAWGGQEQRARVAVAALFLVNGATFANLLPRFPEIKADLALSNSAYGVMVAAFPAGALVAGLAAGAAIRRLGSARVAVLASAALAILVGLVGLAHSAPLVSVALFAGGCCDAMADVGQNAHGLRVQRRYGRSIINSLHAVWAAGAVFGGLLGAGSLAVGMSRSVHLGLSAVLFTAVALIAWPFLLPGAEHDGHGDAGDTGRPRPGAAVYAVLAALVAMVISGAVVEDAGSSWAALYLRSLGASAAISVAGYIALAGALFVGRLAGDRLVDRFGERAVVRGGAMIVIVGMGAALAYPSVPSAIAGFAAAGLGMATAVPAAMHAADRLPGLRPGTGLTVVAWLMRVGFVTAPPVVGLISDAAGLRAGLLLVPVAGLVTALTAGVLSAGRHPARSSAPPP